MTTDPRPEVYKDLHSRQLPRQEAQTRASAKTILGILQGYLQVQSMLDVGCGLGEWLAVAQELGVTDLQGIEGAWLDESQLHVDARLVVRCDLEAGFDLGRRFDLVVCLEVAEHLSESAAERFVAALAQHGDAILFSAAIPFQGGHHHVNERFPDYWATRLSRHGFLPIDLFRPRIWADATVHRWLRQNTLLFANERLLASNERLRLESLVPRPLSVVHPDVYLSRFKTAMERLRAYEALMGQLSSGGTFDIAKLPDGRLAISRRAEA